MLRNISMIAVVWWTLYPCFAFAGTVAVLEGPYILVVEGERSPESAAAFRKRVEEAASGATWQVVTAASDALCEDAACLKQVKSTHQADEAIFVRVEQIGAKHTLTLVSANRESKTAVVTGPVSKVYENLDAMVRELLEEDAVELEASVSASVDKETKNQPPAPATEPSPPLPTAPVADRKGFHPRTFWTSFGISVALAAGGFALEGVGYAKLKDVANKPLEERTASDRNFQTPMRIAEGILFGTALVGAVITAYLGSRTDFKKNKKSAGVTVTPSVQENGGALMLKGAF